MIGKGSLTSRPLPCGSATGWGLLDAFTPPRPFAAEDHLDTLTLILAGVLDGERDAGHQGDDIRLAQFLELVEQTVEILLLHHRDGHRGRIRTAAVGRYHRRC